MTPAALGFPGWIRAAHWINVLFFGFMIRAGIQILAAFVIFIIMHAAMVVYTGFGPNMGISSSVSPIMGSGRL